MSRETEFPWNIYFFHLNLIDKSHESNFWLVAEQLEKIAPMENR